MLTYLIAAVVLAPVVLLVIGAARGRVNAQSCCAPADARRDLRMREAFTEPGAEPGHDQSAGSRPLEDESR